MPLALRLHLQKGDERVHLLLDGLETRQRVELGLELLERAGRLRPTQRVDLVGDPVTRVTAPLRQTVAEDAQAARDIFEGVSGHAAIVPLERGFTLNPAAGIPDSLTWLTKCLPPFRHPIPPRSPTGCARYCSS